MKNPVVSIVVPIYKVERFLRQCVDSILAQTLRDIEVILVDDGSPDSCPAIVDEYAARDSRVVAVHQENGGYGKAVNNGISIAKADYIGIIESDDWVESTMFEKLYKQAVGTGAELVKCMYWIYNSRETENAQNVLYQKPECDLMTAPDENFSLETWKKLLIYSPSLWSCLYKAELLRKVKITETAGASYQDLPFMVEILANASSISVIKEPLIHYRVEPNQNSSSTSRGSGGLRILDMSLLCQDIMKRYQLFELCKEECYYHIFSANVSGLGLVGEEWKDEYYQRFRKMWLPYACDDRFGMECFSEYERRQSSTIKKAENYQQYLFALADIEMKKNNSLNAAYLQLLMRYRFLRFISPFAFGKKRVALKQKRKQIKELLNRYRFLIKRAKDERVLC